MADTDAIASAYLQGFFDSLDVPPATERVAVIVPVMRRPRNAEPFTRSLLATTGLANLYVVTDPDDVETRNAWAALNGPRVLVTPGGPTFAQKVNYGYRFTWEPWVFIVGDDVTFKRSWLDHLQAVGRNGFDVIGTNDLCNPRVTAGEHATHIMIRRSYIDAVGASWDGPGTIAHEGYRHWFVDDEIVTAAKQRHVWSPCLASIVQHNHPIVGRADMDDVYELGASESAKDRDLFTWRLEQHVAA